MTTPQQAITYFINAYTQEDIAEILTDLQEAAMISTEYFLEPQQRAELIEFKKNLEIVIKAMYDLNEPIS